MNITYRELLKVLSSIELEHLDDNISVYVEGDDEFYHVKNIINSTKDNDILDEGHIYLII